MVIPLPWIELRYIIPKVRTLCPVAFSYLMLVVSSMQHLCCKKVIVAQEKMDCSIDIFIEHLNHCFPAF